MSASDKRKGLNWNLSTPRISCLPHLPSPLSAIFIQLPSEFQCRHFNPHPPISQAITAWKTRRILGNHDNFHAKYLGVTRGKKTPSIFGFILWKSFDTTLAAFARINLEDSAWFSTRTLCYMNTKLHRWEYCVITAVFHQVFSRSAIIKPSIFPNCGESYLPLFVITETLSKLKLGSGKVDSMADKQIETLIWLGSCHITCDELAVGKFTQDHDSVIIIMNFGAFQCFKSTLSVM